MMADALNTPVAPWLVLAVGNPSRGDDALGPALIDRLSQDIDHASDVEFLIDFQLQVEHALDLNGRLAVLFVDAAHPGVITTELPIGNRQLDDTTIPCAEAHSAGVAITPIRADESVTPATHALSAQAVLHVAQLFEGAVPPAWQLAIEGQLFDLGEGLSEQAECNLNKAVVLAQQWLDTRRSEAVPLHSHDNGVMSDA